MKNRMESKMIKKIPRILVLSMVIYNLFFVQWAQAASYEIAYCSYVTDGPTGLCKKYYCIINPSTGASVWAFQPPPQSVFSSQCCTDPADTSPNCMLLNSNPPKTLLQDCTNNNSGNGNGCNNLRYSTINVLQQKNNTNHP